MNLFSWVVLFYIALFFVLDRYVIKPSMKNGFMTAGAVIFILLQTAPHIFLQLLFILLTFAILLIGWAFGNAIGKATPERSLRILKWGVAALLAPLVFFKMVQVALPPQLLENILTAKGGKIELGSLAPMGISYFTFRALAYLIEIRRGTIRPSGWWKYFNYVAFWPTVMAGPIERPKPFFDQTASPAKATEDDLKIGLARIASGLFKKMVLGGLFYQIAMPYLLLPTMDVHRVLGEWKTWELWVCVHAYYFYLYLDFAGYSDIAIGLARLFGYRIMENFRWPILAVNVAEFWRRWHISLTGWITDYVYIPLGGNRRGLRRAAFNSIVAMFLVGIWHSLNIHFALWGLYHAVFLILYRQYRMVYKKAEPTGWRRVAWWFATFQIVNLGWVLFIFSAKQAVFVYAKLFGLG